MRSLSAETSPSRMRRGSLPPRMKSITPLTPKDPGTCNFCPDSATSSRGVPGRSGGKIALMDLIPLLNGQADDESRALAHFRVEIERAAMSLGDHVADDRQALARAATDFL